MTDNVFYNPGSLGDIIYAIPFCLSCVGTYSYKDIDKNQFDYMLDLCLIHKDKGITGALNSLKLLGDLIRLQPYIRSCTVEEKVDWESASALDLGIIRKGKVDMGKGDIIYRYHFLRRQPNYYNSEDPWLIVDKTESKFDFMKGKICVFRSPRYRNDMVNFSSLRKYANKCVYMGTEKEYVIFKQETGINLPFFKSNFIDIAKAMCRASFVVGNQTLLFSIAESLKVPRLCEMSTKVPDVMPRGNWGNDFVDENDLAVCLKMYADKLL